MIDYSNKLVSRSSAASSAIAPTSPACRARTPISIRSRRRRSTPASADRLTADPAVKTPTNCLLRGVSGHLFARLRGSHWRRTVIDPYGQIWTPFASARVDVAALSINAETGVSNSCRPATRRRARHAGRRPRISLSVHQRAVLGHADDRADRAGHRAPERDRRSASCRTRTRRAWSSTTATCSASTSSPATIASKAAGALNAGVQYTAQFNRGGFVNVLFGQSYQLFGQNSFAVGDTANTGLQSGLGNDALRLRGARGLPARTTSIRSSPASASTRTTSRCAASSSRAQANSIAGSSSALYGNYAAQPELGFLERRKGVDRTASVKVTQNWLRARSARYDLEAAADQPAPHRTRLYR